MTLQDQQFTLYGCNYSLCSLMTRYALAIRGEPGSAKDAVIVEDREVDIFGSMDQISEEFLLNINAKGQVPVLVNPAVFPKPLIESVDMAYFLMGRYPGLNPPDAQTAEANELMKKLHGLDYYTLSFASKPDLSKGTMGAVEKRLMQPNSKAYENALKFKLHLYQSTKAQTFKPEHATAAREQQARELIAEFEKVLARGSGPWLYGANGPTALDAHFVTFLVRMREAGHKDFLSGRVASYLDLAVATKEWQGVMQGRGTLPDDFIIQ